MLEWSMNFPSFSKVRASRIDLQDVQKPNIRAAKKRFEAERPQKKRNVSNLLATLRECTLTRNLKRGTEVHAEAIECGLLSSTFVVTSLINMYFRCGSTEQAQKLFDGMHERDAVAWTALIAGYVNNGEHERALKIFDSVEQSNNVLPDARLYVAALSACANLAGKEDHSQSSNIWVVKGKRIHSRAVINRCCNKFVDNTLLELLAKGRCMEQARSLFDNMVERNVVTWTCLIQGYVDNGENESALEIFEAVKERGIADGRIYVAALSACGKLAKKMNTGPGSSQRKWLEKGKEIHTLAVKSRCCDSVVENSLIDVFARCGSMVDSREIFEGMSRRDVISWTTLLQGYVENDQCKLALELFERMQTGKEACAPNARTFAVALSACACAAACRQRNENKVNDKDRSIWLKKGERIHSQAVRMRRCNTYVENSLLNLYSRCGRMDLASRIFNKMVTKDTVSWNTLVMGYVENGENEKALKLIERMNRKDSATFVAALAACGNLLALEKGRNFHLEITKAKLEQEIAVANSLIDLYSKCGSMNMAEEVFNSIKNKTIVSWTVLMFGYAAQGNQAERVFDLFERMKKSGLKPDGVTFVCLLTACNHAGLVQRGREYFDAMESRYGVQPSLEHYACMVDLLGRGKCVEEAWRVVETMQVKADEVVLTAVLAACNNNMNSGGNKRSVEIAEMAYERLQRFGSARGFVLMSSIYRKAGIRSRSSRSDTQSAEAADKQVCETVSWIDTAGKLHKFETYLAG